MRIGIDVSAAVNQRAGIGRYARGVLSAMAAMRPHNWVLEVSPRPNAGPPPPPPSPSRGEGEQSMTSPLSRAPGEGLSTSLGMRAPLLSPVAPLRAAAAARVAAGHG